MLNNNLKEKKKALYSIIKPYFKAQGFKYVKGIPERFVKEKEDIYLVGFDFKRGSDSHYFSPLRIHFTDVEDIIKMIRKPNYDYTKGIQRYSTGTIRKEFSESYDEKFSQIDLSTPSGFEQWGKLIIEYMEGEGKSFMEHYSYLPNVLKEMDYLENQGKIAYLDILVGGIDHIFRGLIISKLCNDKDFERKLSKWEKAIIIPKYKEWHSCFYNLKEILKKTEPIYNV